MASLANVAVENDYYASGGAVHEDNLEERLGRIESDAAPALASFLAGEYAAPPELTRFISWLAARTGWLRRTTQERLSDELRMNPERYRLHVGEVERFGFEFEHLQSGLRERLSLAQALQRVHDPEWQMRVHQDQHLDVLRLQAWLFQTEHFPKLRWIRLTAPHGYRFITSDRPVCWDVLDAGVADFPAALRHPFAELTVPLASKHALIAGHYGILEPPTEVTVQWVNERTARLAERYIYGPSRDDVEAHLRSYPGKLRQ